MDEDEESEDREPSTEPWVFDKRVIFVGKLGGVSRREAMQLVRSQGAIVTELLDTNVDVIVIGAEESPLAESELLSNEIRNAAACGELEILHETELWQRIGLVEAEQAIKQLYTPAMLADLLDVSVRVIRRWHRKGLIVPVRTVHKLPYFDFQEVATARRLAALVASGASPEAIEKKLTELANVVPDVQRPLTQLSILVEGKQILLRQGEGLIEPGGQLRIDFDALDQTDVVAESDSPSILSLAASMEGNRNSIEFPLPDDDSGELDPLLQQAYDAEDAGDFEHAVNLYHAILARDGARADISFQLGELLYRMGDVTAARERYFVAIETDETIVEARASLGSVLAETGQAELAVAAFQGALTMHDEYPDVHYNLARTLDDLDRSEEARPHWQRFLQLSPTSPWAAEARQRLGIDDTNPLDENDPLDDNDSRDETKAKPLDPPPESQ
ncbi:Tetratricopeptide repeat protein [Roseimaritima multifibrata]|uniref:Tetratricopeptide repeat protein n=1 Tax=Roseimaritima multifibrata TaxID=1930274 RepID=A0A517ME82_9BACT|nr:Tetratricopeptide repeat protein [Roseimaritima multifibrata]